MDDKIHTKSCGSLFGARVLLRTDSIAYFIRVEATPAMAALIFAAGWRARLINPSEDSGNTWYEVEYDAAIDEQLRDLVDVIADIRFNKPTFGQLMLFDDEVVQHD